MFVRNIHENREMTRHLTLKAKRKEFVVQAVARGLSITAAMNRIGLHRTNFYRWCENDPGFKQEVDLVRLENLEILESELIDILLNGGTHTTERYDENGELVSKTIKTRFFPSTMLRILERRHPSYKDDAFSQEEQNESAEHPLDISSLTTTEQLKLNELLTKCGVK